MKDFGSRAGRITRLNLREQIVEELRSAVVAGELQPGEVYSAPSLAAQFGVSATPVREAMLDLVREGLIQTLPSQGFRVRELTEQDLDEINHLRALLEVPTVRLLAGAAMDPESLTRLRLLAQQIDQAAAAGDAVAHVTADRAFHLELMRLSGNRRLAALVGTLRAQARIYGLAELVRQRDALSSTHEHGELVDLIAGGDEEGAEALMRQHIGHVRGNWAAPPNSSAASSAAAPPARASPAAARKYGLTATSRNHASERAAGTTKGTHSHDQ